MTNRPSSDENQQETDVAVRSVGLDDPGWFFTSLVDALPVCVVCKDRAGHVVFANHTFAEIMGMSAGDLLGKTDFDLFPAELAKKYRSDDVHVMETGEVFQDVEENRREEQRNYFEVRKSPLRDPKGEIVGVQVIFWDVTRRYETEQALAHEQYLLHTLMDNLPDSIYFKDRDSRFVRISRGMANKFGLTDPNDIIGKSDADVFSQEHADDARRDELRIMETGESVVGKVEKETWENGEDTWAWTTKLPLLDEDGNIAGTFGITRDVTDLKATEKALRRAKDEADAANRAKSDFLANMSHEIRTPMNAVIGMTELLLDLNPTTEQREYLAMALASSEALLAIINDLLDFSKIESGKFELHPAPFDLRDSLGDIVRSLAVRAQDRNLELALSVADDVPRMVDADVGRLRQIIVNLVGNAIKFTSEGEVVVDVRLESLEGDDLVLGFSVIDTGIGIPAEKLDRIFGEFEQADSSTTREYGGTGLGLAISSRLVGLMGGTISVESQLGVGSVFRFSACMRLPSVDDVATPSMTRLGPETRVLVVDDNETNLKIICRMLENWGLQPEWSSSGSSALRLMIQAADQGRPFTAVLSDVNMPKMDGFMLAEAIRSHDKLERTPIILLSSGGRPEDTKKAARLGIARRLAKPAKQSEVFDSLVAIVGGNPASLAAEEAEKAGLEIRPLRILLAEDNRVNQKLAVGVLQRQGHQVTVAENGRAAIDAWESQDFDLILMDVQMPEMDGYEATRIIRSRERSKGGHIPIIAMTARAMVGDRQACLTAGMDDYLAKPIRAGQLAEKLYSLQSREEREEDLDVLPSGGPLDWTAALRNVHGNRSLLSEIIDAFLEETPELMATIRQSVTTNDAAELERAAHSMKGAAMVLQANKVMKIAQSIEDTGISRELTAAPKLLGTLEKELADLLECLRKRQSDVSTDPKR